MPSKAFVSFLTLTVDLEELMAGQLAFVSPNTKLYHAWVMDKEGTLLYQSEHPEMTLRNIFQRNEECNQCHISFDYAGKMLTEKQGTIDYGLKKSPRKLAAFATMEFENASWVVVISTPYDNVTSFIREDLMETLLLLGMVVLVLVCGSTLIYRNYRLKVRAEEEAKQWQEKRALEDEIRQSEEQLRTLTQTATDAIILIDSRGDINFWNHGAETIFGYLADEIVGKPITLIMPERFHNAHQNGLKRVVSTEKTNIVGKTVTLAGLKKDGSEFPFELSLATWKAKEEIFFTAIIRDITERKKAEEEIKESTERFKAIFEQSPYSIQILSPDGFTKYVNPAWEKLWGVTIDAVTDYNMLEDEQLVTKGIMPYVLKGFAGEVTEVPAIEYNPVETKVFTEGTKRYASSKFFPLSYEEGKIHEIVLVHEDITERKQTEEQIKKSLKEKEILIKEIHHRVKNNLAVVSGLLNMQSTYIKDKKAIAAFHETRDRIYSMSAVHSQLYYSEDYSTVDYKEYIKNLVSNIFYASQMSGHVKFHLELDDITFPIDKAIPTGLLLNELVTNALKHAFPENRKGNLQIVMRSLEDKKCEIIVKDDGVRIPDNFNLEKSKTFGLKLINLLTKQIDGTVKIESKKGTEFRIRLSTEPGQVIR